MCCGALSCWKMKKSLDIPQIAGNVFFMNRTFLQYSPLTFTSGSTKNNSVHPSFETATETISERLNVGRACIRRLASTLRFSVVVDTLTTPYLLIAYRLHLESLEPPYHGSSRTSPHALSLSMSLVTHLIRKPSPVVSLKVLFPVPFCLFFTPPHSAN